MIYSIFGAYSHLYADGAMAPDQINMSIDGHESYLIKASDEPFLNLKEIKEGFMLHIAVRDLRARSSARAILSLRNEKVVIRSVEGGVFTFDSLKGHERLFVTVNFERFLPSP